MPTYLWASALSANHVSAQFPQLKASVIHKTCDILW